MRLLRVCRQVCVCCIERRSPNYLNNKYFDFLNSSKLNHVFLQGYNMPSVFDLYKNHREQIKDYMAVNRLHGPDRQGIEKRTGKDWSHIVAPRDENVSTLVKLLLS